MEHLDSEKEQLEQIKGWLRENGLSIVLGIVLGLGGVAFRAFRQNARQSFFRLP